MSDKSNEDYYDEFADWYERDRHGGYHALIDAMETDLVLPFAEGRKVLEIGCGTGLILRHVAPVAALAVGLDISPRMLERAQARGLNVVRASATELPFSDASFDLVYSFKVLSHVREIDRAFFEMARVTKPGGQLVLEFYNPWSLRYLAKRLRAGRISERTTEAAVFTRYDTLLSLKHRLPTSLVLERVSGIRVVTPAAFLHRLPVIKSLLRRVEWGARHSLLKFFGGFLVLHLRRR